MSNQAKSGLRVRWSGDESNDPQTGTIASVQGAWMFVQWDGEKAAKPHPAMLLDSPRWSIIT